MIFKKPIYDYKMLDKFKINIDKCQKKKEICLEKMCESNNYIFYKYQEKNEWYYPAYILRQSKENKKNVVFFGNFLPFYCIYKGHLFLAEESGELFKGRDLITCINVENGNVTRYKWKSEYGIVRNINGYGRVYCQDSIKKVYVSNDTLIIEITREKTNDESANDYKYNYSMDYVLSIKYNNGFFEPNYSFINDKKITNNNL